MYPCVTRHEAHIQERLLPTQAQPSHGTRCRI